MTFSSLLLFQEIFVSSYYPNSSIIAAGFLFFGLFLVTWNNRFDTITLSALSFSLAVWCRFDAIFLGLAFLILLLHLNQRSIAKIIWFGFVFLISLFTFYFASHITFPMFLSQFQFEVGIPPNIRRVFTIYSVIFSFATIFFMIYGTWVLIKSRKWRLSALAFLAPLPLIIIYGLQLVLQRKVALTAEKQRTW